MAVLKPTPKISGGRVMVAEGLGAERLVFVDEMGANISLAPLYARSRKGQRACFEVPRNWGSNVTLLASITAGGMEPCLAVEGSTTREVFEVYVEKVPPPKLRAGRVVVMDNLSAHKGSRVRQLIEERGCKLMYLPPYSPDYNPIEQAFSKVKGRREATGTLEIGELDGHLDRSPHRLLERLGPARSGR